MRVLWVSNIPLPQIALKEQLTIENVGGWMIRLAEEISQKCQLTYIFPNKKHVHGNLDKIEYQSFYPSDNSLSKSEESIRKVIEKTQFDIIHVHGTEYPHSFLTIKECKNLRVDERCIVSIQGLVSVYARYFFNGLDCKVIHGFYPKDIIRGNLYKERKRFLEKGEYEIKLLSSVRNVIGRTDWDKVCTQDINPSVRYFYNSETLRTAFYTSRKWQQEKCEKHSIFMSQAGYPVKGGHFAIQAMAHIKKKYPDAKLYIAGRDMINVPLYKRSFYQNYLKEMIVKLDLKDSIFFVGSLDENSMLMRYLNSNIFLSASTIENSPNSVCEAQILGVPVVSSMVGGVPSLIQHGKTGFLYQCDAPYMLAHYVDKVFEDIELANEISINEINLAVKRHDANVITQNLMNIYSEVINGE